MVKRAGPVWQSMRYVLAIAILGITLFPFLWMIRVSLLPSGSIAASELLSLTVTLTGYLDLFQQTSMGRYLFNSLLIGTLVTLGNILFCFMVAYTLARHRTFTNKLLFVSVIAILMIPAHVTIIPLYLMCVKVGLYDSYWGLILPFLVNPIGIFLVKQYIESIPPSMEEAARVDGASELTILFRVVMPVCKPALAVLAIQVFFTNWNSFLFPYILTQSERVRTLPVGLAMFQGHQAIDWQHLMAGSTLAVVPVLIMFAFLQRRIVSGMTAGAVKQ
jgi:ABC-type glycerol-3-phosphate transport system permease component